VKLVHHDLDTWKVAVDLVRAVYELTADFPREEKYGLTAQMRRAAVSVPSNIAEGAARSSKKEFGHYLVMARGSLAELETQLRISIDLGLCSAKQARPVAEIMTRSFSLLSGLLRSLNEGRVFESLEEDTAGNYPVPEPDTLEISES